MQKLVRAQYHFRESPEGLCAWDVRGLIKKTNNLTPELVPLLSIRELDEAYWEKKSGQPITCREWAEHTRMINECDLSFPIILSCNGRIMDGMHRVCKAFLEGRETILAVRFIKDLVPDYIGISPDDLPYDD